MNVSVALGFFVVVVFVSSSLVAKIEIKDRNEGKKKLLDWLSREPWKQHNVFDQLSVFILSSPQRRLFSSFISFVSCQNFAELASNQNSKNKFES